MLPSKEKLLMRLEGLRPFSNTQLEYLNESAGLLDLPEGATYSVIDHPDLPGEPVEAITMDGITAFWCDPALIWLIVEK